MCGICGAAFTNPRSDAGKQVRAMTAALRHRGPDEDGFLLNDARAPGLALGMRRLSIIDLPGGHQPAWNEAKDVGGHFQRRDLQLSRAARAPDFAGAHFRDAIRHRSPGACVGRVGRGLFAGAARDVCVRAAGFAQALCNVAACCFLRAILWESSRFTTRRLRTDFVFASEVRALLARGDVAV